MAYYQNTIDELTTLLLRNEMAYNSTIVIGDNSSGKSELLKRLLRKADSQKWYLVDSVNRYFDVSQVFYPAKGAPGIQFSEKILENRLEENNYNLKDTFFYMGIPKSIEDLYFYFAQDIKRLVSGFLGVSLEIKQSELGYKVYLDGIESALSSGYQAVIRIFMEMEYVRRTMSSGTVVIDEIDEFLFAYNSGRIFEFLKQEYQDFSFVVTTHSADLIAAASQANLILLSNGAYELMDAGDFNSVSQVYNLFESIFREGKAEDEKAKTDADLRRLLNNKISGAWTKGNQDDLIQMKNRNLTKLQKVLMKQIEEW